MLMNGKSCLIPLFLNKIQSFKKCLQKNKARLHFSSKYKSHIKISKDRKLIFVIFENLWCTLYCASVQSDQRYHCIRNLYFQLLKDS